MDRTLRGRLPVNRFTRPGQPRRSQALHPDRPSPRRGLHQPEQPAGPTPGRSAASRASSANRPAGARRPCLDRLEDRLQALDDRLRSVEVTFGKVDQRIETLERVIGGGTSLPPVAAVPSNEVDPEALRAGRRADGL